MYFEISVTEIYGQQTSKAGSAKTYLPNKTIQGTKVKMVTKYLLFLNIKTNE